MPRKSLRTLAIIITALLITSLLPFFDDSSEAHAIGDLYGTGSYVCWESTGNTRNISYNQIAEFPKASSQKTSYKNISVKKSKTSAKSARSQIKKAKKAYPVWEKTSYRWTKGSYKRVTTYKQTVVKAVIKGKKATVTRTVRRMTITETYKHFKREYPVSLLAPLIDPRVADAFEARGWRLYLNTSMKDAAENTPYKGDDFLTGLTTCDTINGTFVKRVDVRVPEVAYHELGHFLAVETDRSDLTGEFKVIVKKEYYNKGNPVKPHAGLNAEEYFADAFAAYCENPSTLKKKAPGTWSYIRKQIDALEYIPESDL